MYLTPLQSYFSIHHKTHLIQPPITHHLHINPSHLPNAFNLFPKSNPPLLHWFQSPIHYDQQYAVPHHIP
ncbi:DNA polymerase beta superfamily protein, partial [Paenibacillus xylanexedens]|uniref:DNA polymerase beta superfamily protein n=1 Tax=Paenibacillus xylanexedens TaxID=528191 RepID=UPI0034D96FC0